MQNIWNNFRGEEEYCLKILVDNEVWYCPGGEETCDKIITLFRECFFLKCILADKKFVLRYQYLNMEHL